MGSQVLALDAAAFGEAKGLRRGEDVIDALAYIDGLNNKAKESAEALIKDEMKQMGKRAGDYLPELPKLHQVKFTDHPLLQAEYDRVRMDQPMPSSDEARLKCQEPPENRKNDVAAWHSALNNAHSQLEHQYNRLQNLELVLEYGPKSWQAYIRSLEIAAKNLGDEKSRLDSEVDDVNKRRKLKHTAAGKELTEMHKEWRALLNKNSDIAKACAGLESEIAGLQDQMQEAEGTKITESDLPQSGE